MHQIKLILTILFLSLLFSCTVGKVTTLGNNGYFKNSKAARTVSNIEVELDTMKALLIVPKDPFILGMVKNINYFDSVITFEDFEKEIIKSNKQDEVGSLSGKIGLNNAYRKYRKFLYLTFNISEKNRKDLQLKLINPNTLDELMVAETYLDYVWAGVNDQNTFNPLFNELIQYIRQNSISFNSRYINKTKK